MVSHMKLVGILELEWKPQDCKERDMDRGTENRVLTVIYFATSSSHY